MESRRGVAEEGVPAEAWRRVSPFTPALDSWKAITVILAVILFQNAESALEFGRFAAGHGPGRILLYVGAGIVVLFLLIGTYSYFAWRAMTYAVTDQAVWMRKGILFRQQRHVRLERIQSVDVMHPLLGRIFGLGRLSVLAAGASDSSVSIGFLTTPQLESLRADILARAAGVVSSSSTLAAGQSRVHSEGEQGREVGASSVVATQGVVRDGADRGGAEATVPSTTGYTGVRAAPERLLYAVDARTLTASLALSAGFIVGVSVFLAVTVAVIVVAVVIDGVYLTMMLPAWLPLILVLVSTWWSRFTQEFNFQAAVSPDGIRVRRGLLEQRAETIPPRRVHAVRITQPLLWRRRNWFRVTINQATRGSSSSTGQSTTSHVLLPVGTREEAMMALWLILPDLGVEDPTVFFDEAVSGTHPSPAFQGISPSARFLDPLVKARRGVALTETCVVIRDGRITRTASFAPYARVQSVAQARGPVERRLRVSTVISCLVPGVIHLRMPHLGDESASRVRDEIVERSSVLRGAEPPERWFRRVQAAPVTDEAAEDAEHGSDLAASTAKFAPGGDQPTLNSEEEDL